jgi:hypothetical protein
MTKNTRTLHIGVSPLNLLAVMRRTQALGLGLGWSIEGDGWECWGEAVGTDVNDDYTLHLTSIESLTNKTAKAVVDELADLLTSLAAQSNPIDNGVVAVLTDVHDYAEDAALFRLAKVPVRTERRTLTGGRYEMPAGSPA